MFGITPKKMKEIDNKYIKDYGISEKVLVEHSALRIIEVLNDCGLMEEQSYLILLGNGNNGADGLALGRILDSLGKKVSFKEVCKNSFSPGYIYEREVVEKIGLKFIEKVDYNKYGVTVDGIFGTGFRGDLSEDIKNILDEFNKSCSKGLSIDIPTGIDGITGKGEIFFQSEIVVALGYPKWAHLIRADLGKVYIGNISFKEEEDIENDHKIFYYKSHEIRKYFVRNESEHKGKFGHIGVIGGAREYFGAPIMSSLGGLKMGSAMATVWTDPRSIDILLGDNLEIIKRTWEEELVNLDSLIIGPGLGDNNPQIKKKLRNFKGPVLIDASGLNLLKDGSIKRSDIKGELIITPHPKEAGNLLGVTAEEINSNRMYYVNLLSEKFNCCTLLKGHRTIVSYRGKRYINITGNSSLAKGGSGDILSGMIASLLGRGFSPFESASVGAYIHGLSGEKAGEKMGTGSVLPRDIIKSIDIAIIEVLDSKKNPTCKLIEELRK